MYMYFVKFVFFFNEGGSYKLLYVYIYVMINYKKVVNFFFVVLLICVYFFLLGKGNFFLYSFCCFG